MTTEKFEEAFKKNVSDYIKAVQDSGKAIIDAQSKQFAFTNDIYSKVISTFEQINNNNAGNTFGTPATFAETIQKNFESISNLARDTVNQALAYGKQVSSGSFPKEFTSSVIENYRKQVNDITALNQHYLDSLPKQFANPFNSSLTEKLRNDFDVNVEATKKQLHTLIDSYNKVINPSFEHSNAFFNGLNEQINTAVSVNLKLWSELINANSRTNFGSENGDANFNKNNSNNERKPRNTKETVEN